MDEKKRFRVRATIVARDMDEARSLLLVGEGLSEVTISELIQIQEDPDKDPSLY